MWTETETAEEGGGRAVLGKREGLELPSRYQYAVMVMALAAMVMVMALAAMECLAAMVMVMALAVMAMGKREGHEGGC